MWRCGLCIWSLSLRNSVLLNLLSAKLMHHVYSKLKTSPQDLWKTLRRMLPSTNGLTVDRSWSHSWLVLSVYPCRCMYTCMQSYTILRSDAHITLFLISQFLPPRTLCFQGQESLYLSPHPRSPNEVFATLSLITLCQKGLASASASHSSRSTSRYSAESFSSCFRLKSPLSSASYQSCVPCSVIHLPHLSCSANLTCRQKWARTLLTAAWCGLMLRELTFTNRPSGFAGNFIIYRSHSPAPVI